MPGFFSTQETQSVLRPDGKTYSCHTCGLYRGDLNSPKIQPTGKNKKGILNVIEYVSDEDDKHEGHWMHSKYGHVIAREYQKNGIDIDEDCLNVHAVRCHPGKRMPTNLEMDCCNILLMKLIREVKPKIIILHGKIPIQSVIGKRWKKDIGVINKWRGYIIPDQELGCFVAPVYSPPFAMTNEVLMSIWQQDIKAALNAPEKKKFHKYVKPKIKFIKDLSVFDKIKPLSNIAFDYETTGLKPHARGHQLVCASVAVSEYLVYAFMIPKKKKKLQPFVDLLRDPKIGKMAHNMKFEETWTEEILGFRISNWHWDSMLAAHVLDNRGGITGLKFQTYVQFGLIDYSSHMEKWLKGSDSKNMNSLNRLLEFCNTTKGREETLEYCALDSALQYRLALLQQKEVLNKDIPF